MNDTLPYLGSMAGGFAILLLQRFGLGNRSRVWLGALLPGALLVLIIVFAVQGKVDNLRGWVTLSVGLLILLGMWGSGQDARTKRRRREDSRIDALNAPTQ